MKDYPYYKIPKRKKWLFTDEFLQSFKDEIDLIYKLDETATMWNTYLHITSTTGFYKALEIASRKHNITKAIYEYACKLPWYNSDVFDGELVEIMVQRKIISEGSLDDYIDEDEYINGLHRLEAEGKIRWIENVVKYDSYSVRKKDWEFTDNPL